VLKRIADLNAELRASREELAALRAPASAAQPTQGEVAPRPMPDFHLAVQEEARRIADQQAFVNKANGVWEKGTQQFPDFAQSVTQMATLLGEIPRDLTEAAIVLGEPEKIIYALSKKPDEAARIALLPPTQRGVALAQFAAQQKTPRLVSEAPAPISPIVGAPTAGGAAPLDDPNLPLDEWMKRRNAQVGRR
jgi:hypothetical protein